MLNSIDEVNIINIILYYVGMVFAQITIVRLYSSLLKPKYKLYKIYFFMFMSNAVYNGLKEKGIVNKELTYIMFLGYGIMFVVVLFEGRFFYKVLAYIESSIAQVISEVICVGIAFGILDYRWSDITHITTKKVVISFLAQIIFMIVTELIIIFQKPVKKYILDKSVLPLAVAFFIQVVIGLIYSYIFVVSDKLKTSIVFWMYVGLILFVDLVIVQALLEMLLIKQTKINLNYIRAKEQVVQEYYTNLCKDINNLSEQKKEYEIKLQEIYKLTGKNMDDEKKTVGDLSVNANETEHKYIAESKDNNVNHTILKDILDSRKLELDELKCTYHFDIAEYEKADINILDASCLLVNMLDNAIEALRLWGDIGHKNGVEKVHGTRKRGKDGNLLLLEESQIYVTSECKAGKIILEVGNVKNPRQKIVEIKGKFTTTKENKQGHGYGMEIIRGIAEKYNGKMEVNYGKDYFINRVWMPEDMVK